MKLAKFMGHKIYLKTSLFVVIISCILLSCGSVLSVQPLSDPKKAKFDKRVEGVWNCKIDSSEVYLHFGKENDNKTQILSVEHKADGVIDFAQFTMFPTIIDNEYYMNLQVKESSIDFPNSKNLYIIVKYKINKTNTLSLFLIDEDKVKDSIKKGDLKGNIPDYSLKKNGDSDKKFIVLNNFIEITDSSHNIAEYIKLVDSNKIFKLIGKFTKMRKAGRP